MAIIRIEFPDKKGLFTTRYESWEKSIEGGIIYQAFNKKVVGLREEFAHLPYSRYKCAFKSIEQMFDILSLNCLYHLYYHGAKFVVIEGEVIEGQTQVVFECDKVTRTVKTIPELQVMIAKKKSVLNYILNKTLWIGL